MEEYTMKRIVLVTLIMVLVLCMVPILSQAGPGGPGGGGMSVPPTPPAADIANITKSLTLTTDQATALKALLTTFDATIKPLMETANAADKAIRDKMTTADFTAVANLIDAAADAHLEVTLANLNNCVKLKASNILTTDQLTKLLAGPGDTPPTTTPASTTSTGTKRR
jgi:hypothetical protein